MKDLLKTVAAWSLFALFVGIGYTYFHEVDAQSGGGFPSNPTFHGVSVGNVSRTNVVSLGVVASGTGQPTVETVSNGYAASCLTDNNSGSAGSCSMPTGHAGLAQTAQPIDLHGTGVQINEVPLQIAFQTVTLSGAACSIGSVGGTLGGPLISACSHSSTGTYVLTFSPAFTSFPVCTGSGSGAYFVSFGTTATTGVTISTFNTSGTLADQTGNALVTCL
jgi:hypothetical protein